MGRWSAAALAALAALGTLGVLALGPQRVHGVTLTDATGGVAAGRDATGGGATGGVSEAAGATGAGQAVLSALDVRAGREDLSPSELMSATLAKVVADAAADAQNRGTFDGLAAACDGALAELQKQVDEQRAALDLQRSRMAEEGRNLVQAMKKKQLLDTRISLAKMSANRANQTLAELREIQALSVMTQQGHERFLGEVTSEVVELGNYLQQTEVLAKGSAESGNRRRRLLAQSLVVKVLSSTVAERKRSTMRRARLRANSFLRHAERAVASASTDVSDIDVAGVLVDAGLTPPTQPFSKDAFHALVDRLRKNLKTEEGQAVERYQNLTATYDTVYGLLEAEASLYRGRAMKLAQEVTAAEREYNMAALGLKKDRELAATERAREFIMRNAMTMVSHVERQCNLTQRAHQLREKHRREDAAGATGVAQLVRELTAAIVEGIQSSGSPDALANDVKGNAGSIDWKESAADVGAAATEIRKEAEAVAADMASTSTNQ